MSAAISGVAISGMANSAAKRSRTWIRGAGFVPTPRVARALVPDLDSARVRLASSAPVPGVRRTRFRSRLPGKSHEDGTLSLPTLASAKARLGPPLASARRVGGGLATVRQPTHRPTRRPAQGPTRQPAQGPTRQPTQGPTRQPAQGPTRQPAQGDKQPPRLTSG